MEWKGDAPYLEEGFSMPIRDGMYSGAVRSYEPAICMFTAQQKHQPGWLASQADMLAEDWQLLDSTILHCHIYSSRPRG